MSGTDKNDTGSFHFAPFKRFYILTYGPFFYDESSAFFLQLENVVNIHPHVVGRSYIEEFDILYDMR